MATDTTSYRDFVAARMDRLRRTAYLLCGDWHTADDLVSIALVKLLRHWKHVSSTEHPDAYVRQILLRAWLDERRRPWRRERSVADLPETSAPAGDGTDRMALLQMLATLPPRRRAVLVLRYFCELSVEETALAMDCSIGTVKSQTAKALDSLRVLAVREAVGRQ